MHSYDFERAIWEDFLIDHRHKWLGKDGAKDQRQARDEYREAEKQYAKAVRHAHRFGTSSLTPDQFAMKMKTEALLRERDHPTSDEVKKHLETQEQRRQDAILEKALDKMYPATG